MLEKNFSFSNWLFWRVENFTFPSYGIGCRHIPQVKKLFSTHPSQTAQCGHLEWWWMIRIPLLHFTKWIWIQDEDFGVRWSNDLTPSCHFLVGQWLPLWKWGQWSPSPRLKWGLRAIMYMIYPWCTFFGHFPCTPFFLLTPSFWGPHIVLGMQSPPQSSVREHVTWLSQAMHSVPLATVIDWFRGCHVN